MSIVTRSSMSKENKELIKIDPIESVPNEFLKCVDNGFHKNMENKVVEKVIESEINLKLCVNDIDDTQRHSIAISRITKRSNSQQSTSEKSFRLSSSSSSSKKMKSEEPKNQNKHHLAINQVDQFFQQEVQRLIASPAYFTFQPVCQACEVYKDDANIVRCTGVCLRYFHRECLKYPPEHPIPPDANFQCLDCWTNTYKCILCGKTDKIISLLHCETNDCGRLYHKTCLDKSNFMSTDVTMDSILSCPAHHCVTCAREDRSCLQKPHKKLIQCIRCPVAFHDADLCTAAGSVELSLSHIICPRHFEDDLIKMSAFKPYHPDWCFKCFKPDAKLLCHYCPSSYHTECLSKSQKSSEEKDAVFLCPDCSNHRQPRYGEIVFTKVSQFRWWPSEIIHPRNAPMNILRMKRPDGTFPILFLGSQEYQWVARSRSISYNIASLSSIMKGTGGSQKMVKDFTFGLQRAAVMHRVFVNILRKYVPLKSITADAMSKKDLSPYINFKESSHKTTKFESIKSNVIIPPAKLPLHKNHVRCDCTDRCQISLCINYLNRMECHKDLCPKSELCENRLFTNYVKRSVGVNKTNNRGFGLKAMEFLKESEFVIEYIGEVITRSMNTVRINLAKFKNTKDLYMVRLSGDLILDAGPKGNLSRFINHSCDPNCKVERWTVNGCVRVGIFAARDIVSGEELSLDYRLSGYILKEDIFCLCGSANCSGFLGPERVADILCVKSPSISPGKKEEERCGVSASASLVCINEARMEDIEELHEKEGLEETNIMESVCHSEEMDGSDFNINVTSDKDGGGSMKDSMRKKECIKEILVENIRQREMARNNEPCKLNEDKPDLEIIQKGTETVKAPPRRRGTVKSSLKVTDPAYEPPKKSQKVKLDPKELEPVKTSTRRVIKRKESTKSSELVQISRKVPKFDKEPQQKVDPGRSTGTSNEPSEQAELANITDATTEEKKMDLDRTLPEKKITIKRSRTKRRVPAKMCPKEVEIARDLAVDSLDTTTGPEGYISTSNEPSGQVELANITDATTEERKMDLDRTLPEKKITIKRSRTKRRVPANMCPKEVEIARDLAVDSLDTTTGPESDISASASLNLADPREECHLATAAEKDFKAEVVLIEESLRKEKTDQGCEKRTYPLVEALINSDYTACSVVEDIRTRDPTHQNEPNKDDSIMESLVETDVAVQYTNELINELAHRSDNSYTKIYDAIESIPEKKEFIHESFCFRCFDGGQLVLCDKPGCMKTYHLSCIGMRKAPLGTWYCPWHFCNNCGEPSELFCVQCPSSYCQVHCVNDKMTPSLSGSILSLCCYHSQARDGASIPMDLNGEKTEN